MADIEIKAHPRWEHPVAFASGASRKNGSSQILKKLGWYWLNSVQAYVLKGDRVADDAFRAASELRAAGLDVSLEVTSPGPEGERR